MHQKVTEGVFTEWKKGQTVIYDRGNNTAKVYEIQAVDYIKGKCYLYKNSKEGIVVVDITLMDKRATLYEDSDVQVVYKDKIVEKEVEVIREVPVDKIVEKVEYVVKEIPYPVEVEKIKEVFVDKIVEVPKVQVVTKNTITLIPPHNNTWIDKLYNMYWNYKGRDREVVSDVILDAGNLDL